MKYERGYYKCLHKTLPMFRWSILYVEPRKEHYRAWFLLHVYQNGQIAHCNSPGVYEKMLKTCWCMSEERFQEEYKLLLPASKLVLLVKCSCEVEALEAQLPKQRKLWDEEDRIKEDEMKMEEGGTYEAN